MKYLGIILFLALPLGVGAQTVHQELQETVRAEVLSILNEEERDIMGTDLTATVQEVEVLIKEGVRKGDTATFENDLVVLEEGDSIYINRLVGIDGVEYFTLKDVDRRESLIALGLLFVSVLIVFSGFQGLRALASLAGSILVIFFVLVPLLLKGYPPVFVSVLVAGAMLALILYVTHGFHVRTTLALLGTFGAVVLTSILAAVWVGYAHLTGLSDDASIYLNFSTKGALDFGGLLLGSIIIGVLGVLDDVAVTQVAVVAELKRANAALGTRDLYLRALRVGRDHVGALVNTLAFAYIGVALPLVLLMVSAGSSLELSLNQEIVAVELIRILVGSIGLILAVPMTTLIAAKWYASHMVDSLQESEHHAHIH